MKYKDIVRSTEPLNWRQMLERLTVTPEELAVFICGENRMKTIATNLPKPTKFKFTFVSSLYPEEETIDTDHIIYEDGLFTMKEYFPNGKVRVTRRLELKNIERFEVRRV